MLHDDVHDNTGGGLGCEGCQCNVRVHKCNVLGRNFSLILQFNSIRAPTWSRVKVHIDNII